MTAPVVVIANPEAGRGGALTAAAAAARGLADSGLPVTLITPVDALGVRKAAADAAARGARAVLACGGDGTIHWAAQGVVGTATAFGVIPAGNGNDIARSLGHDGLAPYACGKAFAVALRRASERAIDVARIQTAAGEERHLIGVLSSGFDSTVNEVANRMRWPGGSAKYVLAMLGELRRFGPVDYTVDVDGVTESGPGILVSIGNGTSFGGGMRICPDATMDDGLLDLVWLAEVGRAEFLRVFPSVYRGTHITHPAVRTLRGTQISLQAHNQVAYADGERIGPLPVTVSVVPRGLRVLDLHPAS